MAQSESSGRALRNLRGGQPLMPAWVQDPESIQHLIGRRIIRGVQVGQVVEEADLDEGFAATIVPMDREQAGELTALDEALFQEYGQVFAEEAWNESNFASSYSGKWDLSFVALIGKELVGYLVASLPSEGEVHIHRVGVAKEAKGNSVADQLYCALWRVCVKRPELRIIAGEANENNVGALRLYSAHWGGRKMTVDEATRYLHVRGRTEALDGAVIVGSDGARTVPMILIFLD